MPRSTETSTVSSTLQMPLSYLTISAGPIVSSMIKTLENDTSDVWTEDHLWDVINGLVTESSASRGKVITPLRHALTGRKVRSFPSSCD